MKGKPYDAIPLYALVSGNLARDCERIGMVPSVKRMCLITIKTRPEASETTTALHV